MNIQDFSFQLMRMQSLFHKQLLKNLESTELSTGQPKILAFLKSHEGKSQKEIAQACQLEPGTVTVLLKRMEKQGMIKRCQKDGDQKSRYIFLTDYGKQLAKLAVESFYYVEETAFLGFSEQERSQLMDYCGRIIENLQQSDSAD